MNIVNNDFSNKYNYSLVKFSDDQVKAMVNNANKIAEENGIDYQNNMIWSGISSYSTSSQRNMPLIFSSSEVNNQRTSRLNSTGIDKVDVITQLKSDSEAVNKIINNNITTGIKEVFTRFGVSTEVNLAIKTYQENEPLSQINALVNQGISALQQTGVDSKTLDKFLYQLSLSIDEKVAQSRAELEKNPVFAEQLSIQEKSSIFQSDMPTLRVWQSRDINETVVRQSFDVKNKEGDIVKISASYVQRNSINTEEYKTLTKALDVTIVEGELSVDEQKQFNQFLDDFAKVTNEILAGDLAGANKAFDTLKAADYGFQSINKRDTSFQQIMDEDVVHSYNKELGHVTTGGGYITAAEANIIDNSYIRGGQYNNIRRNPTANLANFDIKLANTYEQPSSGISKNLGYDNAQDSLYGLSQQYGKSRDGLVLQNAQGDLYQYQYNEQNRVASGWTKISATDVNYLALKDSQTFVNFRLNTENSEQITLTYLPTNTIKDYGTSLSTEAIDKQYSDKYDQQVFEDKSGNLYQYQFNGDYQSSGWLKISNTPENQQLMLSRQAEEGYMRKYLTADDQVSNNLKFANLVNFRETKQSAEININMQMLN